MYVREGNVVEQNIEEFIAKLLPKILFERVFLKPSYCFFGKYRNCLRRISKQLVKTFLGSRNHFRNFTVSLWHTYKNKMLQSRETFENAYSRSEIHIANRSSNSLLHVGEKNNVVDTMSRLCYKAILIQEFLQVITTDII
jgi:hypothetical protein